MSSNNTLKILLQSLKHQLKELDVVNENIEKLKRGLYQGEKKENKLEIPSSEAIF